MTISLSFPRSVTRSATRPLTRPAAPSVRERCLVAAAALACLTTAAQARGGWSVDFNVGLPIGPALGHGQGYGSGYGTAPRYFNHLPAGAVSVQVGGGRYWRHGASWYRPWGPRWVLVAPPIVVPFAHAVPLAVQPVDALPPQPSRPDPVIEPRHGQDAQQTEHDRQQCNRWATTQPAALADAAVFQAAVATCMDGRGYTTK